MLRSYATYHATQTPYVESHLAYPHPVPPPPPHTHTHPHTHIAIPQFVAVHGFLG